MKTIALGIALVLGAATAAAQERIEPLPAGVAYRILQRCGDCATVRQVTREGVWITRVRLRDGSERSFAQEAEPRWRPGTIVRIQGGRLKRF